MRSKMFVVLGLVGAVSVAGCFPVETVDDKPHAIKVITFSPEVRRFLNKQEAHDRVALNAKRDFTNYHPDDISVTPDVVYDATGNFLPTSGLIYKAECTNFDEENPNWCETSPNPLDFDFANGAERGRARVLLQTLDLLKIKLAPGGLAGRDRFLALKSLSEANQKLGYPVAQQILNEYDAQKRIYEPDPKDTARDDNNDDEANCDPNAPPGSFGYCPT